MVGVEQCAELRRLHFVGGVSIRELQRRTGLGRNTIRRALPAQAPPAYVRRVGVSKLDPFKMGIQRLLREEPRLPTIRVLELIGELGFDGGKTLVYDYVAELRPLYAPRPRTFQRTVYRRRASWSSYRFTSVRDGRPSARRGPTRPATGGSATDSRTPAASSALASERACQRRPAIHSRPGQAEP